MVFGGGGTIGFVIIFLFLLLVVQVVIAFVLPALLLVFKYVLKRNMNYADALASALIGWNAGLLICVGVMLLLVIIPMANGVYDERHWPQWEMVSQSITFIPFAATVIALGIYAMRVKRL